MEKCNSSGNGGGGGDDDVKREKDNTLPSAESIKLKDFAEYRATAGGTNGPRGRAEG